METGGCDGIVGYTRGAGKSLALPGRKQARKHVSDASDFNNIETWAVIKFLSSCKGKAPKEIHASLTETLACFLPGPAKDFSEPLQTVKFVEELRRTELVINNVFGWSDVRTGYKLHAVMEK